MPVESVTATKIFARLDVDAGEQYLAYQMNFSAANDLAMILPLPVESALGEDALEFINLKEYDDFFSDLNLGFPQPMALTLGRSSKSVVAPAAELVVHDVGSFEASFVPTVADFSRLDPRFRLADDAWDKLPAYKKFGFAVFKLKSTDNAIHPMALKFQPAAADRVFFPTVHIHDGEVHRRADFDHTLYLQGSPLATTRGFGFRNRWEESMKPAQQFVNLKKAKGLVEDEHVHRLTLKGKFPNRDIRVTPQLA